MPGRLIADSLLALAATAAGALVAQDPGAVLRSVENHGLALVALVSGVGLGVYGLRGLARWAAPRIDRWLDAESSRRDRGLEVQAHLVDALAEMRQEVAEARAQGLAALEAVRELLTELRVRPCLLEHPQRRPLPQVPRAGEDSP